MILYCKILSNKTEDIVDTELLRELGVNNLPDIETYWVHRYLDITDAQCLFEYDNSDAESEGKLSIMFNGEDNMCIVTNVPFSLFEAYIPSKRKDVMIVYKDGELLMSP